MSARFAARRHTATVRARMPQRPLGYLLLSVVAVCVAMQSIQYLADYYRATVLERAAVTLLAAASLLAAEALWCVRPWVVRASMAFLLSLGVAAGVFLHPRSLVELAYLMVAIPAVLLIASPLLWYVDRRAARFFNPTAALAP
ncbi:MAG TPA: hypothetical protein VFJ16_14470 [Longimicrobium sp.]|nr:hypothetical protein [Longimicrobium sp.]